MVSANHLVLWATQEALFALDPGSKNGSFLRVESGALTSVRGARSAEIFLAAPRLLATATAPADVLPLEADPMAFATRLAQAVTAWFARGGLGATLDATVVDPGREHRHPAVAEPARTRLPLVEGLVLDIRERGTGTTELRWDGIFGELLPYVHEQAARWRACHAGRGGKALAFGSPGGGRALREVLEAARLRVPLVLRGESGTGKTALASIYARRESGRAPHGTDASDPPFVTVHCAHLDPALAHARLFGALKGSYTSAERAIVGAVKLADRGVLFLDDVDALPLETQAKLLRFLDEGHYEPLGHGQRDSLVAHVRVVAATNVDLRALVRERRFREDLYWRLHTGAVVRVPPLRERPEDVEALLRAAPGQPRGEVASGARPDSVFERLEPAAADFLLHVHPWRGNFRECLRFCTRVLMEPRGLHLERRRCEAILGEASLETETAPPAVPVDTSESPFERALSLARQWWLESEGAPPGRFDELGRFCETYLKSIFVAQSLGLADAPERPESFDREARARLACDLTTLKRKVDEYLVLRRDRTEGPV
jgi:DNA-binding NtrC family response regulator